MQCIVLKFGGAMLENTEKIIAAAKEIKHYCESGYSVAAVVSAMGDYTDRYIALSGELGIHKREYERLLSYGENISASVLAGRLCSIGVKAKSFTGKESGIRVKNSKIENISGKSIAEYLRSGGVPVISGFQGADRRGEIRVLNRGGSDTTAVYIAYLLNSKRIVLYKDVGGIFTDNPKFVKHCFKIKEITYENMMKMANDGAEVISKEAISAAEKFGIEMIVSGIGDYKNYSVVKSNISHG